MTREQSSPASSMRLKIQADLRAALRERDPRRISTLRNLIAAIDNAEAVPIPQNRDEVGACAPSDAAHGTTTGKGPTEVPRRLLSEQEVNAILRREHESSMAAAAELRAYGAVERAEYLEAEALIAASYIEEVP